MTTRANHWRDGLKPVRETTNKILEMIDEGLFNPRDVVLMCLKWMSEDEVTEMAKANELLEEEEDDAD